MPKKVVFSELFWFKIRDFMVKMREITHFKPIIMKTQPMFYYYPLSLHLKRFLMVKVYG